MANEHSQARSEEKPAAPKRLNWFQRNLHRLKPRKDYRANLGAFARFTGHNPPDQKPQPLPFPPFSWIKHLSTLQEVVLLGWIGSFVGLLLIEAVDITSPMGHDWTPPLIIGSFGATAVLQFGAIQAPFSQPRNVIGGHFFSALVGVAITRLFRLNHSSYSLSENSTPDAFSHLVWLNGIIAMPTALSVMQLTGTVHPPAGATALIAAIQSNIVLMSWRYIAVVLVSALLTTSWACIINNIGRRRYPVYWWSTDSSFVEPKTLKEKRREEVLAQGRTDNMLGTRDPNGFLFTEEGLSNEEREAAQHDRSSNAAAQGRTDEMLGMRDERGFLFTEEGLSSTEQGAARHRR